MLHPVRHHVNSRVLHRGLFTDEQLMPAAILVLLAVGVAYTAASVAVAVIAAAVLLLPVGAMILDNRAGRLLHGQLSAWLAYRRSAGVFDPGGGDHAIAYELLADEEALLAAGRPTPGELQSALSD